MAHLFTEILIMSKACSLVILFIQFFFIYLLNTKITCNVANAVLIRPQ